MLIAIPGSKSVLQRLMVLVAHAKADIIVENYNPCTDVLELEEAMKEYGYKVHPDGTEVSFIFDPDSFAKSAHRYRFQYSATAFRLWLSVSANLQDIPSEIQFSGVLQSRGFTPLEQALRQLGAEIEVRDSVIRVRSTGLRGGNPELYSSISSQFHSSLLLAAPFMQVPLELEFRPDQVSLPYLKLSLQMLRLFGAIVEESGTSIRVSRGKFLLPRRFRVDSDLSAAAFYAVWGALHPSGIQMNIFTNPGLVQADNVIFNILHKMGATISRDGGQIRVSPGQLTGMELCLKDSPDLMPVLSILALFCQSPCLLKGIGRLVHKESDRMAGIVQALTQIGARFCRGDDELEIVPLGAEEVPKVTLDTREDHRLVMAFSLLQSRYPQISLSETASIAKSLPLLAWLPLTELADA